MSEYTRCCKCGIRTNKVKKIPWLMSYSQGLEVCEECYKKAELELYDEKKVTRRA